MKLFFFDLETTGVKHWRNGIHQISGAVVVDGLVREKFDFRVKPNPKAAIEDEALEIGGVSREEIEQYDDMSAVYKKLLKILGRYVDRFNRADKFHLVGYNNASFDNPFFRAFFSQNGDMFFGSWFWSDSHDVMVLASRYLMAERGLMKDFKLKTVASYLGIEVDESRLHDAQYDIYLTMEIYKIVAGVGIKSMEDEEDYDDLL